MGNERVYVTLQNGKVFRGYRFGAKADRIGELVFTTGMTGYIETLTDPSYYGQIVTQTFPLIGNYGIIPEDFESRRSFVFGYIVREKCDEPSNFRCRMTLEEFLCEQGIPGVYGIDTRELTRIVRETGVMNAAITSRPLTEKDFEALRAYRVTDAVASTTVSEPVTHNPGGKYRVVLYDLGAKNNIIRELVRRDCEVIQVPSWRTAEETLALGPDGIMLTNGPGDPEENTGVIENLRRLAGKKPIFGICLGHQVFALAMGGKTQKMKYGHRGSNQPVRDTRTGNVYISSQNHGYEVLSDSVCGRVSFVNANDGTCEGVDYDDLKAYTVQFHPEACGGPHDANYLFDRFIENMRKEKEMTENAEEK